MTWTESLCVNSTWSSFCKEFTIHFCTSFKRATQFSIFTHTHCIDTDTRIESAMKYFYDIAALHTHTNTHYMDCISARANHLLSLACMHVWYFSSSNWKHWIVDKMIDWPLQVAFVQTLYDSFDSFVCVSSSLVDFTSIHFHTKTSISNGKFIRVR